MYIVAHLALWALLTYSAAWGIMRMERHHVYVSDWVIVVAGWVCTLVTAVLLALIFSIQ